MIPLPDTVRIFPLAEVVLFPDTLLPLHIFEPRYRKMLADSMDSDRTIGMTLIRTPESSGDAAGPEAPDVYPVGCAGRIVKHDALPDGRSVIVLRGTVKFRIRTEVYPGEPYRVVEAQALHEPPVPAELMREWRDELRVRLVEYVDAVAGDNDKVEKLFHKLELEGLMNYLCASLPLDAVEKQSLLECATAEQRFKRLCEIVGFKAAEARLGLDATRDADA